MNYLIKTECIYRVPTVEAALKLREKLQKQRYGELLSFSYNTKYIKMKGEIIDEYQLVKVKFAFNDEKEPDLDVDVFFGKEPDSEY